LSIEDGPVAVLLAVEVRQHADGILRRVLVDGGVGVGADDKHDEGRVPDEDEGGPQDDGVEEDLLLFLRIDETPYDEADEQQEVEDGTGVEWQPAVIHEEQLKVPGEPSDPGDDEEPDECDD